IIAVHADSAIQSVNDLQGKTFAFGDELSTIGRFLSQLYLYQHGITASDLAQYDYLERHDAVGAAVGAKEYDAGALKESTFKKLVDNDVPIRELARFPNVTKPWFAHESMTGEVFEALRQALLSMDEPAALEALGKDGFLASSDADYAVIQEAIENNDLFFENE
ncbi:MAG: PhnD/SsuA/transferrin family substrate-binding protein, partial [Hyphomicrobiales bacterium]|nr:PhnD/SsuA/transferrin family substrate-binding protein [Hyphomicrobiales bacterium]